MGYAVHTSAATTHQQSRLHVLFQRYGGVIALSALPSFLDIITSSVTIRSFGSIDPTPEGEAVNIEIHDAALEDRIQKQLQATGSGSVEELLVHLLETQEQQHRWLLENRDTINAKIERGIEQLDRGEGIPEDRLDTHLKRLKAKHK
jgi:hypothetical protein